MKSLRWLVLSGQPYRLRVIVNLIDAGQTIGPYPTRDRSYWRLSVPTPEAVVFDGNTARRETILATYYRGQGVPVVYVVPDRGEHASGAAPMAFAIGCKLVRVGDFRPWLVSDPVYLRCGPFLLTDAVEDYMAAERG